MTFTVAAIGFIGVLTGALISFLGQRLQADVAARQMTLQHRERLREEQKKVLVDFLDAVQVVDKVVEDRHVNGNRDNNSASQATHRMWLQQKCVEILCSTDMHDATLDYSTRLSDAVWHELPPNTNCWDYMKEKRDPFLAAARVELAGSTGPSALKPAPR